MIIMQNFLMLDKNQSQRKKFPMKVGMSYITRWMTFYNTNNVDNDKDNLIMLSIWKKKKKVSYIYHLDIP